MRRSWKRPCETSSSFRPTPRWELEIRAGTIWACELIRQRLLEEGVSLRAFEIDWALWLTGQSLPPGSEPYHRTPTIFY